MKDSLPTVLDKDRESTDSDSDWDLVRVNDAELLKGG